MLLKPADRKRVINLQWHANNNQIEKLADWLLDEDEEFSRTKFSKIILIAERMQEVSAKYWSKR